MGDQLITDFENYYSALPYKGASKEALFHDWIYDRLKELYALGAASSSLPSAEELASKMLEIEKAQGYTSSNMIVYAKLALAALSSDKVSKEVNSHENRR